MRFARLSALCLSAALLLALPACGGEESAATPVPSPTPSPEGYFTQAGLFSPATALDSADGLIRISSLDTDAPGGCAVEVELENRRKSPVMLLLRYAAVNGVQTDPPFRVELAPGEERQAELVLDTAALAGFGVGEATDIELSFLAVDGEDLSLELDAGVPVHLYPLGKERAETYVREEEGDIFRFENGSAKVSLISWYQDRKTGFAANLHLVNRTGLPLNFTVDDAALNGLPCDPSFFVTVAAGKQMFASIYWSPDFLAEGGVDDLFLAQGDTDEPEEEIRQLSFLLRIYDALGRNQEDLGRAEVDLSLPRSGSASPSPAPER